VLVCDLINASSLNFLAGEEGCGKSLLAMNLAVSVAVGAKRWLSYGLTKPGKVLYLNNEMAFDDFARRLKAMSQTLHIPGDIANLVVPKEVPALTECWDTLNRTCEDLQACLLVIDCLYFSHDEDENDSSKMKALMRKVLFLRNRFHLAVLLVHHTKKGSRNTTMHNDQMRGSSVFGGSADTTLQMRRSSTDPAKRIIRPLKGRHVADSALKCRLLSLNPDTLWFRDEGETNEGDHIASIPQTAEETVDFTTIFGDAKELSRKEIQERCKPLGYDERTIDRIVRKQLKVFKYGHYSL
jgi:RecA-family ATPase